MRLFIAVPLPDHMKRALMTVRKDLERQGVSGNWTRNENLHLTLAFLGEVSEQELPVICSAMEAADFAPFRLALNGSGRFGDLLWIGCGDCPQLEELANSLRGKLEESGIRFDPKPFRPHITLLRRGRRLNGAGVHVPEAGCSVTRFSLMQSERIDGKLVYTELHSVRTEHRS